MRWNYLLAFLLTFFFIEPTFSQYQIIPTPFRTVVKDDYFTFSANYQVECYSRDSLLNSQLKVWVKTEAAEKIMVNKMVQTKLSLQLIGQKKWNQYLHKLQLNAAFEPGAEGYVIKIEKNSILLLAQTETALFYGFQSLKQLFRLPQIPCGEIYDKPLIAIRAWQDDISRGPIPTLSQLKKEISELSQYKLNYFTLYTEHVFKYKSHPNIAPEEGLSANEIKELNRYANLFHVTLIANQQSFGHLEKVLAKPEYAQLGESGHILSPANKGSYELLNDFYKEQNEVYSGPYFHINADETFGLGSGQSKRISDSLGLANLYAYHINRIYELLKPSGKKILMWSDIVGNYPDIKNKIPKDIILIPWAYHDANDFIKMLEPIAKSGFDFWVAPGINNWLNLYPNEGVAKNNLYNLIRDGYQFGAKGVLNTSWDDDGFALFGNNWQGFIWGAELSWNPPLMGSTSEFRYAQFQYAFDLQFWDAPVSKLSEQFSKFQQGKLNKIERNSIFFEPIFPLHPDYLGEKVELENKNLGIELQDIYKKTDSLLLQVNAQNTAGLYLKYAMRETQFSIEKNIFRTHYSFFLQKAYSKELLLNELNQLKQKLANLKEDFVYLYLQENRKFYLEQNLQKFDKLLLDLDLLPNHCLIQPSVNIENKGRSIIISSPLSKEDIYYFEGDSSFQHAWKKYQEPIFSKQNIQFHAAILDANQKPYQISSTNLIYHKAIGKIKHINIPYSKYHPSYSGGGPMALADGVLGDVSNLSSGKWQGYAGGDLMVELSFDQPIKMSDFKMGFYQCTPSWVILPKELQLLISEDGINYQSPIILPHYIPVNSEDKIKFVFSQTFSKQKVKSIKIIAKTYGPLPKGHAGEGEASMLFADEIIVH